MMLQKKDLKKHNPNLPRISDDPNIKLIIGSSGSGKTNALRKNNKMLMIIVLLIKF